jgi:hypothetical protein
VPYVDLVYCFLLVLTDYELLCPSSLRDVSSDRQIGANATPLIDVDDLWVKNHPKLILSLWDCDRSRFDDEPLEICDH